MRIIFILLFVLTGARANCAEPPTVLIFGDSLSAGYGIEVDQSWGALLQSRLKEQGYEHRVVNASISGETTEGGATRIESAIADFSPDLIILELGGNDGLRGFPAARMRSNLEKIVARAKASGAAVVLLGIRIPTNYGPRYSAEFEDVFRQVSELFEVQWIEFFMDGIAFNDDLLQEDRIHPNAVAQPILLDNAWPIISATLTDHNQT
jgi:acyl-CoA thioesterase-1